MNNVFERYINNKRIPVKILIQSLRGFFFFQKALLGKNSNEVPGKVYRIYTRVYFTYINPEYLMDVAMIIWFLLPLVN